MVEQSDLLVIYRPFFYGKFSRGVKKEKEYFLRLKKYVNPNLKCFVFCPKIDLESYYTGEFRTKVINELENGKNFEIKAGTKFGELTKEENSKIIQGAEEKNNRILRSALSLVLKHHQIEVKIRDELYPLEDDVVDVFLNGIINGLLVNYKDVVDEFKKDTNFFVSNKTDVDDFFKELFEKTV